MDIANKPVQQLNVKEVFLAKNPGLAKLLPGFVFRYIGRIIHQDDMNQILRDYGHLRGIAFAAAMMKHFNVKVTVAGKENLPANSRVLFIANHPLGGLDGISLIDVIGSHYGDVRFLVNDILMNIDNLRDVFLPINKHGAHSKNSTVQINEAYASDRPMITFPAGLCSRKIKGKITDLEWKRNFLKKSIETARDIVPIYVEGHNSAFFYNLANFRKRIGIKANIEMFFLPHELFKYRNKEVRLTIGKPISHLAFDKSHTHGEWVEIIRKQLYGLSII